MDSQYGTLKTDSLVGMISILLLKAMKKQSRLVISSKRKVSNSILPTPQLCNEQSRPIIILPVKWDVCGYPSIKHGDSMSAHTVLSKVLINLKLLPSMAKRRSRFGDEATIFPHQHLIWMIPVIPNSRKCINISQLMLFQEQNHWRKQLNVCCHTGMTLLHPA